MITGSIKKISGNVVLATGVLGIKENEVVEFENGVLGEVIQLNGNEAYVQCFESTEGMKIGDKLKGTGKPLSVELGPGLVGNFFDGIQRPLSELLAKGMAFLDKGVRVESLDRKRKWKFKPVAKVGDKVSEGSILGEVQESSIVTHRIMSPFSGKVESIVKEGEYTIIEEIANVNKQAVCMLSTFNVRKPRPYQEKFAEDEMLVTGQRVLDTFFPIAKGGSGAIPGGFGSGKTVTLQSIAKLADADIIVLCLCGERGNEAANVINTFPKLADPKTGKPLLDRTVMVVNTSNMPLTARESSIYMAASIAEYYRDMGYDVALVVDSTSRWAEALREISSRLEEMPGEEGFPTYLVSRLAEFYERAGKVKTLNNQWGSLTIMGAISPPGGDFSEPVTQSTLRIVRTLWSLDAELAYRRHYPAVNWLDSYTLYIENLKPFLERVSVEFTSVREEALTLLTEEEKLKNIADILGENVLTEQQRFLLDMGRVLRTGFLQQNALDKIDYYCSLEKQYIMLKTMVEFYKLGLRLFMKGWNLERIREHPLKKELARLKEKNPEEIKQVLLSVEGELSEAR